MPGELMRDVPGSRRLPGEICEHGTALIDPRVLGVLARYA
jgi:hypothetical protein